MKPLPRGRHGLSREFIARAPARAPDRRDSPTALDEHGYDDTTVSAIAGRAGVSKSDFYRHFEQQGRLLLRRLRRGRRAIARGRRSAACAGRASGPRGSAPGLPPLLAGLAAEPAPGEPAAGRGAARRARRLRTAFRSRSRASSPTCATAPRCGTSAGRPPEAADEAVVGGIASLLGRRVLAGETARLDRFFPELAEFALTPYLGVAEARRIISAR